MIQASLTVGQHQSRSVAGDHLTASNNDQR